MALSIIPLNAMCFKSILFSHMVINILWAYKQFILLNNNKIKKKKKNQMSRRHFSKEEIQMANKHMKRCSTLQIIR